MYFFKGRHFHGKKQTPAIRTKFNQLSQCFFRKILKTKNLLNQSKSNF